MPGSPPLHWPLVFGFKGAAIDLLDHADYTYDLQRDINAPAERVLARFFDDALASDVTGLLGFEWFTPRGEFAGATVEEHFAYLSLRMRTIAYVPGTRLAMSIDRCSLPLGRELLQVMDTTPLKGGAACHFHWRVAVRYLPGMSVMAPAVTPLFMRMFQQTLDAVERHFAGPPPGAHQPSRDARASIASQTIR